MYHSSDFDLVAICIHVAFPRYPLNDFLDRFRLSFRTPPRAVDFHDTNPFQGIMSPLLPARTKSEIDRDDLICAIPSSLEDRVSVTVVEVVRRFAFAIGVEAPTALPEVDECDLPHLLVEE
jgi:hypothetical protein